MALHSIMIVDDNSDMLHIYSRVLAQEGYEVLTAGTGNDCLKQIETVYPEIFLMDVVLPDWNGIDLVRAIKQRPEFTNSIFVLLSGLMTDSDNKVKGLNAGALDYMARPIPNKELVAKVKSLIKVMDFQESLVALSKELEQQVDERTRALEVNIAALQREIENRQKMEEQFRQAQKMEAIGTLAGGIAHDFNNILQVISGNAFLRSRKDSLQGEQSPEIDQILEAVERASNLTHGLLAFSRKQTLDLHPINLNDLMKQSVNLGRRLVEESISITPELCPEALVVNADAGLIQQVLFNLITNARDAMNATGVITVRTSLEKITDDVSSQSFAVPSPPPPGIYAVISVSDSAGGISAEIMTRIFEPFFTTKEKGKGTGLGLAMIHGTILQHQGFIVVDSVRDQGTTFRIYLHPLEEAEAFRQSPIGSDVVLATPEQYTILVAEDDESVRNLMAMALSSTGYQVLTAENGAQAVALFQEHHQSVSLILMDVVMPEMNGQEALERIRLLNPDIPCMFMTGYGADILSRHDIAIHGSIIRKPFSLPDLLLKVRTLLDQSQAAPPAE
jgi:polar amino acid transport system substrate-binding protein